jgi:hypothetical protein
MLIEFFKDGKGNYSHTRLISIIGSFCVFIMFLINPANDGIQNLMTILLSGSLINATASKFADRRRNQTNDSDGENNENRQQRA